MVGVLVGLNFPFIICNKGVVMKYLSILLIACLGLNVVAYGYGLTPEENARLKNLFRENRLKKCDTLVRIAYPDEKKRILETDQCKEYRELREKCTPEARNDIPDCKFVTATK